ncbi:MAG: hypothetical protein NVSMB27_31560 [Ktedonobacteraceae bacterium]
MDRNIGNYHLVSEIGSGAFGNVYRGEHLYLKNRTVAIKVMHTSHLDSERERQSFLEEARFLEMLTHPHSLPILDVGISEGFPYLVTEYAVNGSLRDRMQQNYPALLPIDEALRILSQTGQALHHAHQQNVIHRDLKPANILFNAERSALLADFGIATTLASASIKLVKEASGSAPYMAPEQFQGLVSKEGDQYALGCIAYELFTGYLPFSAPDPFAIGFKHLTEEPPAPRSYNPDLPVHIEQAVLKAMQKQRTNRYPDVLAFITALQAQAPTEDQALLTILPTPLYGETVPLATLEQKQKPDVVGSVGEDLTTPRRPIIDTPVPPVAIPLAPPTEVTPVAREATVLPVVGNISLTPGAGDGNTPLPPVAWDRYTPPPPAAENFPIIYPNSSAPGIDTGSTILVGHIIPHPAVAGAFSGQTTENIALGTPRRETKKRRRRPLLIAAILALLLLLIPGTVAAFYTFDYPATVTATITPLHTILKNTFDITMVSSKPIAARNQVAGVRLISSSNFSQTNLGSATGVGHTTAIRATGQVTLQSTFTNFTVIFSAGYSLPVGSTGLYADLSQSFNLTSGQTLTTSAYITTAGAKGNIAAGAINDVCCVNEQGYTGEVTFKNYSAFGGGVDSKSYPVVQQSDINNAIPSDIPLKQSGQADLRKQVQKNEHFFNTPQCTSSWSPSTYAGSKVSSFSVTTSASCTGEVYNILPARSMAVDLLKNQASTRLDPSYQLASNIVTRVIQTKLIDAKQGTLQLTVEAEGIWGFHFSDAQKQNLAQLINGRSLQDAQAFLSHQTGVSNAQVIISGDFWIWNKVPTSLDHIAIKINAFRF